MEGSLNTPLAVCYQFRSDYMRSVASIMRLKGTECRRLMFRVYCSCVSCSRRCCERLWQWPDDGEK